MRHADNSEVWVSAKARAIYAENGSVTGMLGFVQDISMRKSNEETLREQAEAFLRAVRERSTPMVSGEQGRRVLALALQVANLVKERLQRHAEAP